MQDPDHDLVLVHMMVPRVDGLTASAAIRAGGGQAAAVPIVGLTANATESGREACLAAGMNGFLTNPVSAAQLSEVISQPLG